LTGVEMATPTSGYPSSSIESPLKGNYGASTSAGYGLSTNDMPFNTSLSQQMTTPLQLFRSDSIMPTSKQGYQVPLTGNVNAIDDSTPGSGGAGDASPTSSSGASGYGGEAPVIGAGSSWLYDLEQLRKKNQALKAELAEVKKEQRGKFRARTAGSFNQHYHRHGHSHSLGGGGGHHYQQQSTNGNNPSLARLDALASASGINAMNAHRSNANTSGNGGSAVSTTWSVSFPGATVDDNGGQPPLSLSMPPPKRSWSQTDMHAHSEWHH